MNIEPTNQMESTTEPGHDNDAATAQAAYDADAKAIALKSVATEIGPREPGFTIAWYNSSLGASRWFELKTATPKEAASLLCRFNPHDTSCDPEKVSTDKTEPCDFKTLLRAFEDVATDGKSRQLVEWLVIAKVRRLKYHPWIDHYIEAATQPGVQVGPLVKGNTAKATGEDNTKQTPNGEQDATGADAARSDAQSVPGAPESDGPTARVTQRPNTNVHLVENRKNILFAVIGEAKKTALDPEDPHSHWAAFVQLAQSDKRPSPLLGYAEDEGVKYQGKSSVEFLTLKNFLRRVKRPRTTKDR